jgi:hypothetical protein
MMIVRSGSRPAIPARVADCESNRPASGGVTGSVADEPQAWSIGGKLAAAVIRFASGARLLAANASEVS